MMAVIVNIFMLCSEINKKELLRLIGKISINFLLLDVYLNLTVNVENYYFNDNVHSQAYYYVFATMLLSHKS